MKLVFFLVSIAFSISVNAQINAGGFVNEAMAKETGGGENFARFIQEEIFPYIASRYPVSGYRALIGHSFGGLFALHVLAKHSILHLS